MGLTLKNLNEEQHRAVTHEDGPLLIVAGAGTGKTTVITQRIGHLVEEGKAKSSELLALTFTKKAAEEMEERLDRLLPYGVLDLWVSTFHAFAEKILQRNGLEIGLPNTFKLLNQTEQWLLVRKNLGRFELDYYRPLGNPTKFIHALITLFSRAKDELITPQDYLEYAQSLRLNADGAEFIKTLVDAETLKQLKPKERKELLAQEILKNEEAANAYHVYQQLLHENDALDFGDLINHCLELFKKRPAILARYRRQFRYILVDEFQDTNYAQYELIKLLAAPSNNITVVGDDDQSIYKFRGASVSNILEFKRDYPKAQEVFLTQNYRSTQNILDLSYAFIQQNNPDRLEVRLAQRSGKKLSKKLVSNLPAPGRIEHWHFATAEDEVYGVITRLIELKEQDTAASWNDFAILARTNDGAGQFVQGLRQTNVPFQVVASRGLYSKDVVADILAYLRLLDDYHESSAVYRLLQSPVLHVAPQHIAELAHAAKRKGYSLYAAIRQPEIVGKLDGAVQQQLQQLLNWVSKHAALARAATVGQVVMAFLQDSGYLQWLSSQENMAGIQTASYLNQFYKKITEFEKSTTLATAKDFLELIELELEAGESGTLVQSVDEGPEAVKVMTVHAAKGLEFGHVFIVNLVDRRFPTDDRSDPIGLPEALIKEQLPEGDAHLQEERRLLYVAMTRAKRGLYLTSAADYGGSRRKKLSRFLLELQPLGLSLQSVADETGAISRIYQLEKPDAHVMTPEEIERLLPKKFSFTQLKAFQACPYHYWLEYVLRIPQPGKHFFSFGTSMHATLQQFFETLQLRASAAQQELFGGQKSVAADQPAVALKELLELYERQWIDDWYPDREKHDEYKQNGAAALKLFYAQYLKSRPVPKFLEQPFNLPLHDGQQTYELVGKIDRIDPLNSGVEIIDYKTGQGKTEKTLSPEDRQQLLIYQLAASRVLRLQVERLTYYYLETGERVHFLGTQSDLEKIEEKLVATIRKIRATPFPLPATACTCR